MKKRRIVRFRDYCSTCILYRHEKCSLKGDHVRFHMCSVSRYIYGSSMMYVYIVKQKALGCVYIRKYIRRRRVSRYQRAERRVQSSYQRKVVVLRRLTVRLSLPLSLPSFFLSALSIRGSLQSL